MLGKRLITALVIFTLLAACGSDPVRDDAGPATQAAPSSSSSSTGTGPDGKAAAGDGTASPDSTPQGHGGCCGGDFGNIGNGDPRVLLGLIVVIVVVVAAVVVYHLAVETVDSIRHHTHPADKDATADGVYRDPRGLFSVAIPVEYPSEKQDKFEVRQTADKDQEQVFFVTSKDEDPVYSVSVQPLASDGDTSMPLSDFASKLYPPPRSADTSHSALLPVYQQDLILDGKPALFREYSPGPAPDGKHRMYYLLYFMRDAKRSAVLSITWSRDCPSCSNGPEAAIRGTDSELRKFVESFHMPVPAGA